MRLYSFTVWLQQKVGVNEAFCFEPEPDSFRLLNFNLSKNGCVAAHALPCAVGGEERTVQISLKESSPGGTSIYKSEFESKSASSINVIRFEDWLQQTTGDFDLLKIDCEGAEWEILQRTDRKKFERFRVFAAEVHNDPENKCLISDFVTLTEKLGFRTIRWDAKAQGLYIGVRDAR